MTNNSIFESANKYADECIKNQNQLKNVNTSGIYPCGHRVLIAPEEIEEKSEGGIVLMTASIEKQEALAQTFGRVIAIGNTAYADQPSPWCKVGDRVSFAKYSGLLNTGKDGIKYRIINDLDVVSVIDEDVK